MGSLVGVLPVAMAAKELRIQMRSRYSLVIVTLYAAVLALVAAIFLLQHRHDAPLASPLIGSQLFAALAIFQLCLVLFVTPATMAGAVSGERQRRTWDLLQATRLSSFDIVVSKLLMGVTVNALLLSVSLPFLTAVFLFGSVAPSDVVHTYVVLLATVVLLTVVSLFVSVLTTRPVVALVVSNIVSMVLGFGLSLIIFVIGGGLANPGWGAVHQLQYLADIDPLVALLSVLPAGHAQTLLGVPAGADHLLWLTVHMPLWEAFGVLAAALAAILMLAATLMLRTGPPWLRDSGS